MTNDPHNADQGPSRFRILCASHLIWERTLFQRPQQLMRRFQLAGHSVAYFAQTSARRWLRETAASGAAWRRGTTPEGAQFVTLPYAPLCGRFEAMARCNNRRLAAAVRRAARRLSAAPTVLWLYHPDLLPLADRVPHDALVYDVMDHFSAFRLSRPGVEKREAELLRRADVVFTGGRSMHEAKIAARPDAHCFPSGVDVERFGRALLDETPIPGDMADLPRPILGYYGAVDERLDYELVEAVCRARPDWSVVFIGPLVIGSAPGANWQGPPVDAPNFHYLGPRDYERLPEYLKAFDVAIMPWAQSELTAHISPTKTPEYLAGGRPVVSTPIPDVERDYGDVVAFARSPDEFIAACERLMAESGPESSRRLAERARGASWETIARKMAEIILTECPALGADFKTV